MISCSHFRILVTLVGSTIETACSHLGVTANSVLRNRLSVCYLTGDSRTGLGERLRAVDPATTLCSPALAECTLVGQVRRVQIQVSQSAIF